MNRPKAYASLLDTRQVAERLGVHQKTAQRLIGSGEIPGGVNIGGGTKAGTRWRISEEDLQRWIDSRRAA